MKFLIFFFAYFVVVNCHPIVEYKQCEGWPEYPQELIPKNTVKFVGTYYEQYRSPLDDHTDVKCIRHDIKSIADGFEVEKRYTDKKTDDVKVGSFSLNYEKLNPSYVTDSVVIQCKLIDSEPYIHINTRDRFPSEEVTKEIKDLLSSHNVKLDSLFAVDQKNCSY